MHRRLFVLLSFVLLANCAPKQQRLLSKTAEFRVSPDLVAFTNMQLQDFERNAAMGQLGRYMDRPLMKWDARTGKALVETVPRTGQLKKKIKSAFSQEDIRSKNYVLHKDKWRQKHCWLDEGKERCLENEMPGKAPAGKGDLAKDLLPPGKPIVDRLDQMEQKKLRGAVLEETPWSDHYWPIYQGQLGSRYGTPGFRKLVLRESKDFRDFFRLGLKECSINQLSPAEKYDLLVGNRDEGLTKSQWANGLYYQANSKEKDQAKKVADWMGICHGWAPASYMVARPRKSIDLLAADGDTKIRFYPSDIKALASLLWAQNRYDTRFVGSRCNAKDPKKDNGRIVDQKCFDTNPGTWHQVVVNQIGVHKQSFVMDATYDFEVWNQPVYAYAYAYFNPQTKTWSKTLKGATVTKEEFTDDRFRKFRTKTRQDHLFGSKEEIDLDYYDSVVGIVMEVYYVDEKAPNHRTTDSAKHDGLKKARYIYDLELKRGKIVGGEWYSNLHPDFLWTPNTKSIITPADRRLNKHAWNKNDRIPENWERFAKAMTNNPRIASPLAVIVERLVEWAQ